jgi:hypothetical protein
MMKPGAVRNAPAAAGLGGYGYQWRISPGCCRAGAIEAGDVAPCSGSGLWFWIAAVIAVGAAVCLPARRSA